MALWLPLVGVACNEDSSPQAAPAESAAGGTASNGGAGSSGTGSNTSGAGGHDTAGNNPGGASGTSGGNEAGGAEAGGTDAGGTDAGGTDAGGSGAGGASQSNEWGAAQCAAPTAEVGYGVGQSLGPLVVKDCETGAEATLDELCGADATWIFVAHSHCPTCKATAGFSDSVAEAIASKNVAIAHILYNDNGTSCATWKEAYKLAGLPNLRVYEDPTGAVWQQLKTSNYTAPSAFLDRNRVITYKAHGLSQAKVLEQIDGALTK